jgi:DNA gyrase subunit A
MGRTERIEFDEKIVPREIVEEMEESYLDYAMSVIVGRAIPDVRDGMKVIHRRIIHAMSEGGHTSDKPTSKSAKIIGDVMGKYHPHGNDAIYDALVRMAQPWNMRYPLIEGQGNFGSNDGDAAAAMRYTEVRLLPIAEYLVRDIKKDTVEFTPTFDARGKEPAIVPAGLPLLLMNGTEGIAVGMATRIPPHNLRELGEAIIHLVGSPDATADDLMQWVKGPDFPAGGFILGTQGIKDAFREGRGSITIRGRAEVEQDKRDRFRIVITEVPYQVNKATLVEKIAELVASKKLQSITDIRDESDRSGTRVVVELKRDANPQVVLNNLYKNTPLQISYGIIMLALTDGAPRVMGLKRMLSEFVSHRRIVIVRRTKHDLQVAEERAHILEGLRLALDRLDEVIETIRSSKDRETASFRLQEEFGFTEVQAKAILDMRLAQLTGLEREKVENELQSLIEQIKEFKAILADPKKVDEVLVNELREALGRFGDERRTVILPDTEGGDINEEDLVKNEPVVVTITSNGYIKRVPLSTYRVQARGGRGLIGQTMKADDIVRHILTTNTLDTILCFTNTGNVYSLRVFRVPPFERTAKGTPIVNLIGTTADERVTALVSLEDFSRPFLFMCTRMGVVKKVELSSFAALRVTGKRAIGLSGDDSLDFVSPTTGKEEIIICTSAGLAVRFSEDEVRAMGTAAQGVRGIKLTGDARVVGMNVVRLEAEVMVVSRNGSGKRTKLSEFRQTHRGTKGIICMRISAKTGPLVSAHIVGEEDEFIIVTREGMLIRSEVKQVSRQGRATQGVRVINLREGDAVASVEIVEADDKDEPLFT